MLSSEIKMDTMDNFVIKYNVMENYFIEIIDYHPTNTKQEESE